MMSKLERVEDDPDAREPDKLLFGLLIALGAAMAIGAMIPIWTTIARV